MKNRCWVLASRPDGMVRESDFFLVEAAMPVPDLKGGQFLAQNIVYSFDPAMRGWIEDVPSYMPPVGIGETMRGPAVARVIRSQNPQFPEGALVRGLLGWQEYCLIDPVALPGVRRLPDGVTPEAAFSATGGSGVTAYYGLLEIAKAVAGDTVVVSSAAGSVGSIAAQIARLKGCRVIGIAGGAAKCAWLREEAKLDATIDYHSENVERRLAELCPGGIDVFFDNVGGAILEAVIEHIADHGRIALCGMISLYNDSTPAAGPKNMMKLVTRRVRMQGFITFDFQPRFAEAEAALQDWISTGQIKVRTDLQHGFENIPKTLLRLFSGENDGKQLLAA